jgi:hypothetical protein
MPPIRFSRLAERFEETPVSFNRSAKREEMEEKRPKRSEDPEACWGAEFIVVSWVSFVVARTLRASC